MRAMAARQPAEGEAEATPAPKALAKTTKAKKADGGSRARSGPGWLARPAAEGEDTGQPGRTLDATGAAIAWRQGAGTKGEARHPCPPSLTAASAGRQAKRARGSAP